MQHTFLWLGALLATTVSSASSSSSVSTDTRAFTTITGSDIDVGTATYTPTYATEDGSQIALNTVNPVAASSSNTASSNVTTTSPGSTSTITVILGGGAGIETLRVINGTTTVYPNTTASATVVSTSLTSTSAAATNTQACNGWPEFCARSYGNITQVAAHDAFYNIKGNAASNQEYSVTQQLDDGVRMLTGGVTYENDTLYFCHTSCDLLNAGTLQSNYEEVAAWVEKNPYDVVTLLIVNSDYVDVSLFVDPIQNSGLSPYIYTPPYAPMLLDQWPTLTEMILLQQRVVIFMDYQAEPTVVPWILDEFSQMWETPFSPTNVDFPCSIERPPTLTNTTLASTDYLYIANHNLNVEIAFAGIDFLIPNTATINTTNSAGNDTGMLGLMDYTCYSEYDRHPNWLLVDYYDRGDVEGSVFQVAAAANGVVYDKSCCGTTTSSAGSLEVRWALLAVGLMAVGIQFA